MALFVVQRQDARCVAPNVAYGPQFAQTLRQAADAGVELLARLCRVQPTGIEIGSPIPVRLTKPPEPPPLETGEATASETPISRAVSLGLPSRSAGEGRQGWKRQ